MFNVKEEFEITAKKLLSIAFRCILDSPIATTYARELVTWYLRGSGKKFSRENGTWGWFMRRQPAIIEAANQYFEDKAKELAGEEGSGPFSVDLNAKYGPIEIKSLAMLLTLHGAEKLEVKGHYEVKKSDGEWVIRFENISYKWAEKSNFVDGCITEISSTLKISDDSLKELGEYIGAKEFDIEIIWHERSRVKRIPRKKTKCNVDCKYYERYGKCDRRTYDGEICWQHT